MKSSIVFKRLSAAFVACLLAVCACAGAFAAEKPPRGYITAETEFYNAHREAVEHLAEGLYNMEESIDMSDFNILISDFPKLMKASFESNPDLFYIEQDYSWSCNYYSGSNYIYQVMPHYIYTADQVEEYKGQFYLKADYFLDMVSDDMSDFEKALVLHDALCTNSAYNVDKGTYDLMVNGEGRCFGYSQCYAYLLAQLGIKSEIVSGLGNGGAHQWVKVCLYGNYYNVDVTFDDPSVNGSDCMGFASHANFLMSDTLSTSNGHSDWTSAYSSDSTYDGLSIRSSDVPVVAAGGKLYTVDQDNAKLVSYDIANDSFTNIKELPARWTISGTTRYYPRNFSSIASSGDYLYYNGPEAIYAYNPATGEETVSADRLYCQTTLPLLFSSVRMRLPPPSTLLTV